MGTANVAPGVASEIFDNHRKGNLAGAKQAQEKLLSIIDAFAIGKYPAALKEAMSLIGVPVGPLKKPLTALSTVEKKSVAALLRSGGFLR